MSTPGAGGPQPPEQDPSQSGPPANWGQQPPAGQPQPGQEPPQQPWGAAQPPAGQPQPGQEPPQQPWGAAQPPAGQPYPGQQPWGAVQPPAGAPAFGQAQQPEKPEKPKRKWLPIVGGIVALIVVLGGLSSFLGGGDPEVGDCIKPDGTSFQTVDCNDDTAQAKIVGTDADMTGEEFDATSVQELCLDFANATSVLWYGSDNAKDGHVYCAEDV